MNNQSAHPSILASLRALIPQRGLDYAEAVQIAELQASRLGGLLGDVTGVYEHHIAGLPRMVVEYEHLVVSGMSHWTGQQWVITLRKSDSLVRQRFTLLHEFKHIIDHGSVANLYRGANHLSREEQAERAADYFAGCALIGRRELKALWGQGLQHEAQLAAHFGVSRQAVRVRLAQTGLDVVADTLPAPRCARPTYRTADGRQHFRAAHSNRTFRSQA